MPQSYTFFVRSWPGLTAVYVTNYMDKSLATTLGHLYQKRKKHPIKKLFTPTPVIETEDGMPPNKQPKLNVIFDWINKTDSIIYSDQNDHFP